MYRNNGSSTFTAVGAGLLALSSGSLAWGDYNNDGYLDLAISGITNSSQLITRLYRNVNGVGFSDTNSSFVNMYLSSVAWADFDSDGRLDLALSGANSTVSPYSPFTLLYRNINGITANTPPSAPISLAASINADKLTLQWSAGSDTRTPTSGLVYNVRLWAAGSSTDTVSPISNRTTGWRLVPAPGNAQQRQSITLNGLTSRTYYCWVQTIDSSWGGSSWSSVLTVNRYYISGYVRTAGGTAVSGVTMSATGGRTAVTDTNGYYQIAVEGGWNGSVWPSKTDVTFTPTYLSYTNVNQDYINQNYTATLSYRISGTVRTSGGTPVMNVLMVPSTGASSVYTNASGYYEIVVPSGWNGTVTPWKTGYTFAPGSKSYTNIAAHQTLQDYTGGPVIKISGVIQTQAGVKVPDVIVSDGGALSVTTDANGYYELMAPAGWSGTITPSKALTEFTPTSRTYIDLNSSQSDQNFTVKRFELGGDLENVVGDAFAWGDFDNDGHLDFAIAGIQDSQYITRIYHNNGDGSFTDMDAGLEGLVDGAVAWGDYNNDGYLDLTVAGYINDGSQQYVTRVYRNYKNGTFGECESQLNTMGIDVAWGDYDNDGFIDLVVAGYANSTKIYRNNGQGGFVDSGVVFPKGDYNCASWADYNKDGRLDLLICGYDTTDNQQILLVSRIYRNDGNGVFTDISAALPGLWEAAADWADFDNDGDLDLALMGSQSIGFPIPNHGVYRNDNGVFTALSLEGRQLGRGDLAWGDYDNDGDSDLVVAGQYVDEATRTTVSKTNLYRNDAGMFVITELGLPQIGVGEVAWGDYNSDNLLDLAMVGCESVGTTPYAWVTKIYRFTGGHANSEPSAPGGLAVSSSGNDLTFSWTAASDDETPQTGLSYNLRVGTTLEGDDVFSGLADSLGKRRIPALGNAGEHTSITLRDIRQVQTYYWSVQAIDTAFAGSVWASGTLTRPRISGYARFASGMPIRGAKVSADNGGGYGITDVNGYYELFVNPGWSGKLSASKEYYSFTPVELTLSNVTSDVAGQDFTGTPPNFEMTDASFPSVIGEFAWGDYDGDGYLDLAFSGRDLTKPNFGFSTYLYHNNADGTFTRETTSFTDCSGKLAWGDYDNDGKLDLLQSGTEYVSASQLFLKKTYIYHNDGNGSFTRIHLLDTMLENPQWGDFDGDGRLDVLGSDKYGEVNGEHLIICRNNGGGTFSRLRPLADDWGFNTAWADYDADGVLDLAYNGPMLTNNHYGIKIYHGNGDGTLTETAVQIDLNADTCLSWGDFDNDGDLDLLASGQYEDWQLRIYKTCLYRNDGPNSFTEISTAGFPDLRGSGIWGDYDNDGYQDVLWVPYSEGSSKIYRNNHNGTFTDIGAPLPSLPSSLGAWGDYDNDGDLDIVISCDYYGSDSVTAIYKNNLTTPNNRPIAPGDLMSLQTGDSLTLTWSAASDMETPAAGLTYNIRIGTTPGGQDLYAGMADTSTGTRRVAAAGNRFASRKLTIKGLDFTNRTYYWSVQTVDSTFAGSVWADEVSLSLNRKISGVVRNNGIGITGVKLQASDGSYAVTDSSGNYQLAVSSGWNGTVTPQKLGFVFEPASRLYADVISDFTGQDYASSTFTGIHPNLPGLYDATAAWGDYDGDGKVDIALTGKRFNGSYEVISRIYRNTGGGVFTNGPSLSAGVQNGALAWGDYDGDGRLDLAIAGEDINGQMMSKIFHNNADGTFTDIGAGLAGLRLSSLSWADFDNDGDLDLAACGASAGYSPTTKIYRNDDGAFIDINADIVGIADGSLAWGDYDNDGYQDLAITGTTEYSQPTHGTTRIYRNLEGTGFDDAGANLPAMFSSTIAWGDYDSDGWLDLAISGRLDTPDGTWRTIVFHNDRDGSFTDSGASILPAASSLAWGDFDNNGSSDLLLVGSVANQPVCRLYLYKDDGFKEIDLGIAETYSYSLACADYDNDADLDIALVSSLLTDIYRNDAVNSNTPPNAPTGLSATATIDSITFNWSAASDAQTPAAGLTYNLRVGTAPGKDDVFSSMANLSTGQRRVVAMGNAQKRLSWTFSNLPSGAYYWSVQAIDASYVGSAWAQESQVVVVNDAQSPVIESAAILPDLATAGDTLYVVVQATDNVGVTSVTAGGIELTDNGAGLWTGVITASTAAGDHIVVVTAKDAAGNTANGTASYKVVPIVGIANKAVSDSLISDVADKFMFKLWGMVSVIDANSFWLDDGSGMPVKVDADGHNLSNGDFASARGALNISGTPATLISHKDNILKLY